MDRKDSPVSMESVDFCQQNGVKWVDCQKLFMLGSLDFQDIRAVVRQSIKFNRNYPYWFHCYVVYYDILLRLYTSIYKRYQVKILIQHQEHSWIQEVQKRAVESAGGIMLGFHWSNLPFIVNPEHLTPQHVFFLWGKNAHEWLFLKGNSVRHALPCGIWMVPGGRMPEKVCEFSNNIKFVISIFDSSCRYNDPQSPETLSQFYLCALELLEENVNWAGIVKPKNFINIDDLLLLPQGKQIAFKMRSLVEHKRLVLLNNLMSPIKAAACSSLSLCYGLNSAGIIAGICGYRSIHWDCGWLGHPIWKDQNQNILYHSLDDIRQATVKASQGDETSGDFDPWRDYFDYFNDFNAATRVGGYIQNFIIEITKTNDVVHSLDICTKKYIEKNKVGKDFFESFSDWEVEI